MPKTGAAPKTAQRSPLTKLVAVKKRDKRDGSAVSAQQPLGKTSQLLATGKIESNPDDKKSLASVMEMESLDEFLVHAKMTRREFEAQRGVRFEKGDTTVVVPNSGVNGLGSGGSSSGGATAGKAHLVSAEGESSAGAVAASLQPYEWHAMPMPERPPWSHADTPHDLDAREAEAFLDWRRRLAVTEETVLAAAEQKAAAAGVPIMSGGGSTARMTPYEKNIEVWRQLWRVVERSDVLVQVVDARNPLFYFSQQLHAYARSHYRATRASSSSSSGDGHKKGNSVTEAASAAHVERIIVLNKADFLTKSQRAVWAKELTARGLRFVWFSAKLSQEALNAAEKASRENADMEASREAEAAARSAWAAAFPTLNANEEGSDDEGGALTDDEEEEEEEAGEGEESVKTPAAPSSAVAAPTQERSGGRNEFIETTARGGDEDHEDWSTKVLSRAELLRCLEGLVREATANREKNGAAGGQASSSSSSSLARGQVGIVGYPNVGKSSVINVMIGATPLNHLSVRVATGAMPGKTKHFQTIDLKPLPPALAAALEPATAPGSSSPLMPPQPPSSASSSSAAAASTSSNPQVALTLCDCPGLVFPQFVSSAAEMLLAGVLPVNQLRDHMPPMRALCLRIPKAILEFTYGFKAPEVGTHGSDANSHERAALAQASKHAKAASAARDAAQLSEFCPVEAVLVGVGTARSWMASGNKGEVDRSRVARMLLSDMQAGKLLFAQPPPTMPHGSAAFANFAAATHRARFADLRRRKGAGPKSTLDSDVVGPTGTGASSSSSSTSATVRGSGGGDEGEAAAALAARLEAIELSSMGDFEEGEAWMDEDLGAELNGNTSTKHTRLRAAKDAKVQRKHGGGNFKQKIKGKRLQAAQMRNGESGDQRGGGAHVAGHTAKAVAHTRVVLPHHASDQPTSSRPSRSAIST